MGVSENGGTPIYGWFMSGNIPSFEMDDDWEQPYDETETTKKNHYHQKKYTLFTNDHMDFCSMTIRILYMLFHDRNIPRQNCGIPEVDGMVPGRMIH